MSREKKKTTMSAKTWGGESLVRAYYVAIVRPSIVQKLHPKTVARYDSAVARFEKFVGGKPRLGTITDKLLNEFRDSLPSRRCSKNSAKHLATSIRRIVRIWTGEELRRLLPLPPAEPGTLRHYFEHHYRQEAMFDCKKESIDDTRRSIRALNDYAGAEVQLSELDDSIVAGFLEHLRKQGRPATTVNGYRATLLAVWNHAFYARVVNYGPRVRKLREVRNPPEAWSLGEMKKLLAAARRFRPGECYGVFPCNHWWSAILQVAYDTGLRRSSLFALRQCDVDLSSGWLVAEGSTTKTLRGQSFKLSNDTLAALGAIWTPDRDRIFEGPTQRIVGNHFDILREAAGVRRARRKGLGKFHMLRRTTATLVAARAGVSAASAMLGHSDTEVTRRYLDPTQMQHDVTKILPSLAAG